MANDTCAMARFAVHADINDMESRCCDFITTPSFTIASTWNGTLQQSQEAVDEYQSYLVHTAGPASRRYCIGFRWAMGVLVPSNACLQCIVNWSLSFLNERRGLLGPSPAIVAIQASRRNACKAIHWRELAVACSRV
jgi:hypothetical protein